MSTIRPIDTEKDIARGLKALLKIDPRLTPIAAATGLLPLRRREGGFEGLAHIITSQQTCRCDKQFMQVYTSACLELQRQILQRYLKRGSGRSAGTPAAC